MSLASGSAVSQHVAFLFVLTCLVALWLPLSADERLNKRKREERHQSLISTHLRTWRLHSTSNSAPTHPTSSKPRSLRNARKGFRSSLNGYRMSPNRCTAKPQPFTYPSIIQKSGEAIEVHKAIKATEF